MQPNPKAHIPNGIYTTYEEGVEHLRNFNPSSRYGYHYALLMYHEEASEEKSGKFAVYERIGMPCYGELRTYGPGSTRPNDHRPNDLSWPFPDGTPVALVAMYTTPKPIEWCEWSINPAYSPWRTAMRHVELVVRDNKAVGILFLDTDVDSTVLVNYLKYFGRAHVYPHQVEEVKSALPEGTSINEVYRYHYLIYGSMSFNAEVRRLYHGEPLDLTGGTFKNRYAYNRPQIEYLFGDGKSYSAKEMRATVLKQPTVAAKINYIQGLVK